MCAYKLGCGLAVCVIRICRQMGRKSAMFKINQSPESWFLLGVVWSITVLVLALDKNNPSWLALSLIGALAVFCYGIAAVLLFKRRRCNRPS